MNLSKLIETIEQETKRTSQWEDGNYLSELLLRLASYYATLGRFVAEAEQDSNFAEVHYKFTHEHAKVEFIKAGETVALAESKSYESSKKDRDDYVHFKYKYRLLNLTRQSLETTIDAIRSRLSYMKSERDNV